MQCRRFLISTEKENVVKNKLVDSPKNKTAARGNPEEIHVVRSAFAKRRRLEVRVFASSSIITSQSLSYKHLHI